MRANNAQELLSIEPTIKLVKNNPKLLSLNTCNLEYWTSNAIKGHEFVGNFIGNYGMGQEFYYNAKSAENQQKILNFTPMNITAHIYKFTRMSFVVILEKCLFKNLSENEKKELIDTPLIVEIVNIAVANYYDNNNHTTQNIRSMTEQQNLMRCMNILTLIEKHLVTLQFLWNFDHRSCRFYLNDRAYFSLETLKNKIIPYLNGKGVSNDYAHNFVLNLYNIARALSMRPKFHLVLICCTYKSGLVNVMS